MTAGCAPFVLAPFAPFGLASFGQALFGPAPFGLATFGRAPFGSCAAGVCAVGVCAVPPFLPSPVSRFPSSLLTPWSEASRLFSDPHRRRSAARASRGQPVSVTRP